MNLLFDYRERRLRAFWRLLFQFVLSLIGAALLLDSQTAANLAASPAFLVIGFAISFVVTVVSVWFAGRFFDRRPFSGFGLRLDRTWWLDFCFGLVLGALLMAAIFLVELLAGWITVTGTFETVGTRGIISTGGTFALAILIPLVLFVCVGFYEELLSRGYQLQNMAEGLNYPSLGGPRGAILLAWVLSSSLFGLFHLGNPNATPIVVVNIAFAGLLLGAGYVLTGRLAIPIGLHITWNFFQGNVFGFPVSGIEPIGATFISLEQGGPTLFTGGVFGPEAGLLDIAATIIGSLLIWLWVRARSGKATLQTSIAEPPVSREDKAPGDA